MTVCTFVPLVRPLSAYGTEVAPALTVKVVELVPSLIVAVPARALVSERVPLMEYALVALWQSPGVTLKVRLGVTEQEAGAV